MNGLKNEKKQKLNDIKLIEKLEKLANDAIKTRQNSNLIVDLLKHANVRSILLEFIQSIFTLFF